MTSGVGSGDSPLAPPDASHPSAWSSLAATPTSCPKNIREDAERAESANMAKTPNDNFVWQSQQQQQRRQYEESQQHLEQQQQQEILEAPHYASDQGGVWEDEEGMVDVEAMVTDELGGSRTSLSSMHSQEQMIHLLPEKNPSYGFKERQASLSCRYRRQRHKVAGDKWKTIGMGGNRESHPDLTQQHRSPSDGSLGERGGMGGRPPLSMTHASPRNGLSREGKRQEGGSMTGAVSGSNGWRNDPPNRVHLATIHSLNNGPGRPPVSPFQTSPNEDKAQPCSSSVAQQTREPCHPCVEEQKDLPLRRKASTGPPAAPPTLRSRSSSRSPAKGKRGDTGFSSSVSTSSHRSSSCKPRRRGPHDDSMRVRASHALAALVHDINTHSRALIGKFVKAADDTFLGVTAPAMGLFLTFAHDLPRAVHRVHFEKDLRMPMPRRKGEDTRHSLSFMFLQPIHSGRGRKYPTVLVRNPYGRLTFFYFFYLFAQRGYNVVVQDVRGRGESTGVFDCLHDHDDGQATLEWITSQPWYSPEHGIGLLGMSYNGFVLYSTFKDPAIPVHPAVKAVVPINTTSRLSTMSYRDGPLHLELIIRWSGYLWTLTRDTTSLLALLLSLGNGLMFLGYFGLFDHPRLVRALRHLPVEEITHMVTGVQLNRFQMFLSPPGCDFVKARDASAALRPDLPPAQIHASWYDIFLIDSFFDFNTLVAAGNRGARLMISSDYHVKRYFHYGVLVREALTHFKRYLRREPLPYTDAAEEEERVTMQIIHAAPGLEWMGLPSWPPAASFHVPLYLSSEGGLVFGPGAASKGASYPGQGEECLVPGERRYTYFPSDPTPSVGGNGIGFLDAGERVQNQLEASRGGRDLLVYTSGVLEEDMYVIGSPRAELHVRCMSPRAKQADFVVRLCDVSPDGTSRNVCDGVRRVDFSDVERLEAQGMEGEGGKTMSVAVEVYPTAVRFPKGHRVRVHVASAGFIRWERNVMGYGYPSFIPVRFEVLHGGEEGGWGGSVLHLPLVPRESLVPSRVRK